MSAREPAKVQPARHSGNGAEMGPIQQGCGPADFVNRCELASEDTQYRAAIAEPVVKHEIHAQARRWGPHIRI